MKISDAIEKGLVLIGENTRIDEIHLVLMEDDGKNYGPIIIGDRVTIRAGAIICSGVEIGSDTIIGHNAIIRRGVSIGSRTVISHGSVIEREATLGSNVRISSLTHITGRTIIEDFVEIGARVVTINDKYLTWQYVGSTPFEELTPPTFKKGCRVGSGSIIQAGVTIGEDAIIGAGAVVTKTIPAKVVAFGVPAYVQRGIDG